MIFIAVLPLCTPYFPPYLVLRKNRTSLVVHKPHCFHCCPILHFILLSYATYRVSIMCFISNLFSLWQFCAAQCRLFLFFTLFITSFVVSPRIFQIRTSMALMEWMIFISSRGVGSSRTWWAYSWGTSSLNLEARQFIFHRWLILFDSQIVTGI